MPHNETSIQRIANGQLQVGTLQGSPFSSMPQYYWMKIENCPSWSYRGNDTLCHCPKISGGPMICNFSKNQTAIQECFCTTHNEESNISTIGMCPYNCFSPILTTVYAAAFTLISTDNSEWSRHMCGRFNRQGPLCSQCQSGLHVLTYSLNLSCTECSNGSSDWWKYVLRGFLPLTVFYAIIICLNINIPSSQLQAYVLYCQIMTSPMIVRILLLQHDNFRIQRLAKIVGTFYEIWNLSFFQLNFPGICLETNILFTFSLDYIIAAYPLILTVITYWLIQLHDANFKPLIIIWKPFNIFFHLFKRNWNIKTSMVDAFATFFYLSIIKFINVSADLLIPVKVYQFRVATNISYTWRPYYNASLLYFKGPHLPYGILAITALSVFVLSPTLILLLSTLRTFQRCFSFLPYRVQIILRIFLDSFQGCYKDGTEVGTQDCRWFSAMPIILHMFYILLATIFLDESISIYLAMILVLVIILIINTEPFKTQHTHMLYTFLSFSLLGGIFGICSISRAFYNKVCPNVRFFLVLIWFADGASPLLFIIFLIFKWTIINRQFCLGVFTKK